MEVMGLRLRSTALLNGKRQDLRNLLVPPTIASGSCQISNNLRHFAQHSRQLRFTELACKVQIEKLLVDRSEHGRGGLPREQLLERLAVSEAVAHYCMCCLPVVDHLAAALPSCRA